MTEHITKAVDYFSVKIDEAGRVTDLTRHITDDTPENAIRYLNDTIAGRKITYDILERRTGQSDARPLKKPKVELIF